MIWSYGVTTAPQRKHDLLPKTLLSLTSAGFPSPRLFVDGEKSGYEEFGLDVTYRWPLVRVYGNWVLSMWELYLRDPWADRYAIFQDDAVFCAGLRRYLEACPLLGGEARNYLNLYTVAGNYLRSVQQSQDGWFVGNQLGKGALALVFDNRGVRELLASRLMVDRPWDSPENGWRSVDGAVSEALCRSAQLEKGHPYTEWCHRPSLCQHTGRRSAMDKRAKDAHGNPVTDHDPNHPTFVWGEHTDAPGWQGEGWDVCKAMGLGGGIEAK